MKKAVWILWITLSVIVLGYFARVLWTGQDQSVFLIGDTTYGHYQIEMSCGTCHSSPFGGKEVLQNACIQCHADELEESNDSHPKSKFTDPREAYRLEKIDARYCISCHVEHQRDDTHAMGVTLPDDYCYHCHIETIEERESHKNLRFDSCADAGCHNYHDNRALYESFLVKNSGHPWLAPIIDHVQPNYARLTAGAGHSGASDQAKISNMPDAPEDWHGTGHQIAGVGCVDCHTSAEQGASGAELLWIEKPQVAQCEKCHQSEVAGFKQGKHGMRLAVGDTAGLGIIDTFLENNDSNKSTDMAPITPRESHLQFHNEALDAAQGCNACHGAHSFDTQQASVESCLACHKDEHSLSYEASPHGMARNNTIKQGFSADNEVSCATCHMPRISAGKKMITTGTLDANAVSEGASTSAQAASATAKRTELWRVQHNQNWNLRPNEKMIRPVCMQCHSLEFSIDALADEELIQNNFSGKPKVHVESVDWALERERK